MLYGISANTARPLSGILRGTAHGGEGAGAGPVNNGVGGAVLVAVLARDGEHAKT